MSLRGVWIVFNGSGKTPMVIFSRRWLTVERRAKTTDISSYYPIPADHELCAAVVLHSSQLGSKFSNSHDGCKLSESYPMYELFEGLLWPVICMPKNQLLYVSVPFIENSTGLTSASITAAVYVLDSMAGIVGEDCTELNEGSSESEELHHFLCCSLPFGSPLDVNFPSSSAVLQLSKAGKSFPTPKVKKAAWQSGTYKGVSKLGISISEEIRAVLYDDQNVSDVCEVNGIVQCKADLEGYPDILLTLTTPTNSPSVDHILTHPCVHTSDNELARQDSGDQRNRKLRFSSPIGEMFTLAHYQWSSLAFLPIRGFYQMKCDQVVKLLIQLKLHNSIRNNFDYFEVHIPFFNRGAIEKVDNIVPVTASSSLALSQDRRIVIWTIGQKFPSKSLEMSLQANVHFFDQVPVQISSGDNFCVGANSYIDLFFKISDFTLSGCEVDTKSITLFPASKYKLTTGCELYSSQYRIWNSHGEALCVWPQLK